MSEHQNGREAIEKTQGMLLKQNPSLAPEEARRIAVESAERVFHNDYRSADKREEQRQRNSELVSDLKRMSPQERMERIHTLNRR